MSITFDVIDTLNLKLQAYSWDIVTNFNNDYKLLFKTRIRYPTVIYYLSRSFNLSMTQTTYSS